MVVLGISLGTTTSSTAILEDKNLIHYNTHSFRTAWSEFKVEQINKRFCQILKQYTVDKVIIKLPPVSHQPESIRLLTHHLKELCERKGCAVQTITRKELKHLVPEIRNNAKLMQFIVKHYPEITPYYERALKRKNNYHKKLFEAIAVAHIA